MRKSPQELWPPVPSDPYRMSVSPAARSLPPSVLRTYMGRPAVHTVFLLPAVSPCIPAGHDSHALSDRFRNRCEPVLPYLLRHSHFCAPPAIPPARESFPHSGTDSGYAALIRSPCLPGRNTPHRHGTVPGLPGQIARHRHPLKAAPVLPAEAA